MYSLAFVLPLLAALPHTLGAPSKLHTRQANQSTCSQFDTVTQGDYQVQNDAWGQIPGGNQCSQIDSLSNGALAWSTTFTWGGDKNSIKTYANAESPKNTPCKALNSFQKIPTSWSWSLSDGPITADVSYDAFLNPTCDGPGDPHTYEVMVWLAQLGGLNPIGTSTATAQIGSTAWNLWKGQNTQTGTTVFSFVAPSTMNSFTGDLMDFFNYLVQNQGVDAGLMLTTVQAGTEVSVGSNLKFTTSGYRISSS